LLLTFAEGIEESHRWSIVCNLSLGIAKGLDHLHTGLDKPMVHGNLKTSNVLLDANYECRISDYGLYLLLSPAAAQEMLEASAAQGYKAPELVKMRDATCESDVYSLGVVLLELLAQKERADDGEGEEPERLLRAGHGLLQPVAVPETQHEAGTQEARGDREINGREC
jgi:serine/threonine protein kinase